MAEIILGIAASVNLFLMNFTERTLLPLKN